MMKKSPNDFFEFDAISEDYDVEVKSAAGRDGRGEVPKRIWESYSAMANTEGGLILLGAKEEIDGRITWHGLKAPGKAIKELWNNLNNPEKVSANLLTAKDIYVHCYNGKDIVVMRIPRAGRAQRPVYVGSNPLTGTFRRFDDGDRRCTPEQVKKMLAEQTSETKDDIICEGFGMEDIDIPTLQSYRQVFSNRHPDHPFDSFDNLNFLKALGGYRRERQADGKEGLTLAGLLMFGTLRSILEHLPTYIVDYQERDRAVAELRWVDRVTTDFTWPGNLYSFYRIVIAKLTAGLKVPFILKEDQRVESTPVHEAIREALVNCLIHADYSGGCSILVVKRPDLFGFRNPGILRVPLEDALRGGTSDCRNRNLQKMFQMVGLCEQAGSGFLRIYRNWEEMAWKRPEVEERFDSNQTLLRLRMDSLLPEDSVIAVKRLLGVRYERLSRLEKIAVVTAKAEKAVQHKRLLELSNEHPADITHCLQGLLSKKLLLSEGNGRGTFYYLPGEHPFRDQGGIDEFLLSTSASGEDNSEHLPGSSEHLPGNSEHLPGSSEHLPGSSEHLQAIAAAVSSSKKVDKQTVRSTIVTLCSEQALSLAELSRLLSRSEDTLRVHYINPMCDEGILTRKHPAVPNHPQQKYSIACEEE